MTGAAKNTQHVLDALQANGVRAMPISTAVALKRESSGLTYHVHRLGRMLGVVRELVRSRNRSGILYIVPDAGLGAWYTVLYALLGTLTFRKFVFHHHSFRYIARPLLPMRLLVWLTRRKALHVFLSDDMARAFVGRYGALDTVVAGNACFVQRALTESEAPRRDSTITIGHLSNLRRNKGFFAAADTFEHLADEGLPVRLHFAGPITDKDVEPRLQALKAKYGDRVQWAGPVSDDAKVAFYRGLDVFLFATTHPQEAQPNVIYEALAAGIPVLATPRACIPKMLVGESGACSPDEDGFVDFAVKTIRTMSFDGEDVDRRRKVILTQLMEDVRHSQQQYRELLRIMGAQVEPLNLPWL
jgi:glycosyltransferase involved in cell wall biosynthesis